MSAPPRVLTFQGGRIRVDAHARVVLVGGRPARLGGRAFDVLAALVQRRDRVVPKQELLDVVWPGLVVEENNLQVHVMNLRKVLGSQAILTVSGRGYQFVLDEDDAEHAPGAGRDMHPADPGAPPVAVHGTALIGRDELIASTCALLRRDDVRLVTLAGPGGSGKTRVGLRVTAELSHDFTDGSYVVLLAPLRDPARVASAIASVLNVQELGSRPIEDLLLAYLRERAVLLALDNFEHLMAAASLATALLEGCPRLKILVTSRSLLHLGTEAAVPVPPLAVPSARASHDEALRAPAVRLFVERARDTGCALGAAPREVAAAVDICRRLDGLPLAIELAAARLRVLTPVALAERLGSRLSLLKANARDVPERQRTLREAIAWSHDLLDADEQRLFRRLAVFVGGWTADAAEAIAGADGLEEGVLDLLSSLIDHNLVQRTADVGDEARFTMLETVREFALERFEASDEADAVRGRHADYFVTFAETVDPRLRSGNRAAWLTRMHSDYNNVRAALSWVVVERADAVAALRLAGALAWYWYFAAQFSEGRGWISLALGLDPAQAPPVLRARALSAAARLAFYSGSRDEAIALARQSVALFRAADEPEPRGLAFALFHLALGMLLAHEHEAGIACFEEAGELFRSVGDEWGIALAAAYRGAALSFDPAREQETREVLNEARCRGRALGDDWLATVSLHYLATIALRHGDYEVACRLDEEAVQAAHELGDHYRVSRGHHQLAEIALARDRPDEALDHLRKSMALCREQARIGDLALQLRLLARVKAAQSWPDVAVRCYGAASRLEGHALTMPPDDPVLHDRLRESLRARIGDRRYESAWALGASMPLDELLRLALAAERA
jgi:non-specific serine/threonine protein kinase